MNDLILLAHNIAKNLHAGQVDGAGVDYYSGHLLSVEWMVIDSYGADAVNERIVAILHDSLEDHPDKIDSAMLMNLFGDEVANAVIAISKIDGEEYSEYILRVKMNDIARKVKLKDLSHNMDNSRLKIVDENRLKKLEVYNEAFGFLSE